MAFKIKSHTTNQNFRDNYDKVFGKKPKLQSIDEVDKLAKANKKVLFKYDIVDRLDNVASEITNNFDDKKPMSDLIVAAVEVLESQLVEAPQKDNEKLVETDEPKLSKKQQQKLEKKY